MRLEIVEPSILPIVDMKAELVPLNGDPPIPITRDVTVVGRREYCDVCIDHSSLSKRHCVLVRTDGLLMMRDLATTNGSKVNGQRVLWAALLPNDRLTLGGYKVRVYLGSDDAPSPSEIFARRGLAATTTTQAAPADRDDDRLRFATPSSDPDISEHTEPAADADAEELVLLSDGDVALRDLVNLDDDDIISLR